MKRVMLFSMFTQNVHSLIGSLIGYYLIKRFFINSLCITKDNVIFGKHTYSLIHTFVSKRDCLITFYKMSKNKVAKTKYLLLFNKNSKLLFNFYTIMHNQ